MRMTIPWVSTLWCCERNMNLGFKRPRFQSWLCHQLAARSPPTSTFSRSHVLWLPQGVNQVSCAASVDICFVSSGIFHGDVSPDRFMAGFGSVPWKHSSCDETRMSSCRLSISQHRHSHPHPNNTPPHNLPPLQPTLSPQPKNIQIISLESDIQQDSLLLIGRAARAHPYRYLMYFVLKAGVWKWARAMSKEETGSMLEFRPEHPGSSHRRIITDPRTTRSPEFLPEKAQKKLEVACCLDSNPGDSCWAFPTWRKCGFP